MPSTPVSSLGIDWFTCSFPREHRLSMRESIAAYCGEFRDAGFHPYGYTECEKNDAGVFFAWSPETMHGHNRPEACLSLPGTFWAKIDFDEYLDVLNLLRSWECDPSRLDVKWDDFQKIVEAQEVERAAMLGDVSGFKKYFPAGECKVGDVGSRSCRFGRRGSKGSGKMLQIYDKSKESKGAIDAIRWELSLYGERASMAFEAWASCETRDQLAGKLGALIGGSIDFRIRSGKNGKSNASRCPRYSWWQKVVELLGASKIGSVEKNVTAEKLMEWMQRNMKSPLSAIKAIYVASGDLLGWERFIEELTTREREFLPEKYQKLIDGTINPEVFDLVPDWGL